jgi:DNA-binding Lrp family transcriptional regulator
VSVENDERSGRSSTTKTTDNVEKIRELIQEDRRRTIHELADTIGISYETCQEILTENLNMRRIATKFVPRLLTNDQSSGALICVLSYDRRLTRTQLLLLSQVS